MAKSNARPTPALPAAVPGVDPELADVPLVDGEESRVQLQALGEAARSSKPEVRRLAASQLGRCRVWRRRAAETLWPLLVDSDAAVQATATGAFLDLTAEGDLHAELLGPLWAGLLGRAGGGEFRQSLDGFGLHVRVSPGADAPEPAAEDDPPPIADLLAVLRPAGEIRSVIRRRTASSASALAGPLNAWLRGQTASALVDKRTICQFVNDLVSLCGTTLLLGTTPCYLSISTGKRYPDGVIYLVPFGSSTQLATRTRFADLPELGVAGDPAAEAPTGVPWTTSAKS